VGRLDGVLVVDDSKATNPHATVAALRSFDPSTGIVLIAGGIDRGVDLTPLLAEAVRLRCVVALGETAGELERVFAPTGVPVKSVGGMDEAVRVALDEAKASDVVLLSPACASLDMYANYAIRGEAFREACLAHGVVA
jgi:UDP-N-acetylmuramoylalanine--D-glutamate ligase